MTKDDTRKDTWVIEPLRSKYYGTVVRNTATNATVTFWTGFRNYTPDEISPREISNGWNGLDHGYDHVENVYDYDLAVRFCENENRYEEENS